MTRIDMQKAQRAIDTIRLLAADMVEQANSGHPGTPMEAAPIAYLLYHRHMRHNPKNPEWQGRDRFILSCCHASALLYSMLHLSGYKLSLEELKNFRQVDSPTAGHPEFGHAPGIETTTGPLGQGISVGVGMAMGGRFLQQRVNPELFDYRIYGLCSDGDLMEGVASETASLAGHLQLGNLVYLYDDNQISIEGSTELTFTENVGGRFEAYGWQVQAVDGHDRAAIREAIVERPADWRRVLGGRRFREAFTLGGEFLKRAPRGFDPDHPLIDDLKRKDFICSRSFTEKQATSPSFLDRFTDVCRETAPLVKFITEAVGHDFD